MPMELLPRDENSDEVGAVKLERNELVANGGGSQRAVGTGEVEVVPVRSLSVCSKKIIKLQGLHKQPNCFSAR